MDQDDENYALMEEKRELYMREIRRGAIENGVKVSQWELEEIEMAFEHGFAHGFLAGYQELRRAARKGMH